MWLPLNILITEFVIGLSTTWYIIPQLKDMFIKKGISGKDMSKNYGNIPADEIPKIPEAQGLITGLIFLILTITMMPPAVYILSNDDPTKDLSRNQLLQLGMALLSICMMLLLGFMDNVLDLKWRHKLFLPPIASLPILVVYSITPNQTEIVVPLTLRPLIGSTIELGMLYYVCMLISNYPYNVLIKQ